MNNVRYQVFVSSTYNDLRKERQEVIQAILELGHFPVGMEMFPASDETSWTIIEKTIAECDYYVVILGGKYGSLSQSGLSYTEREYDLAVGLGVPVLGFIHGAPDELPGKALESDPDLRAALKNFRAKVLKKSCRPWTTATELGMQVLKSLNAKARPRIGWVKADQAKSRADFEEMEELRRHINSLQSKLKETEERAEELEQILRSSVLPDADLQPDLLSSGTDIFDFKIHFSDGREHVTREVGLSWNEIFRAIGPKMFDTLHRRGGPDNKYAFEDDLVHIVRELVIEEAGNRKISLPPGVMEAILMQFKQLGFVIIESGEEFRGWMLTPKGEAELTRLLVQRKR